MAAVISFEFGRNPGRFFTPAQTRLTVALTLSAFAHFWLAAGVEVDAPARMPSRGPAIITARLEWPETIPEARVPRHSEAKPDAIVVRQESREGRGGAFDAASGAAATNTSPAPLSLAAVPEAQTSGQALTLVPDPVYYPARQLDAYPALLQPVRLEYPERASYNNISGKVLAMLLIDETGSVNEVSIVKSEPPGYFEDAVRDVFAVARFFPARKGGRAVKSRVLISVSYNPGEAEGAIR